MTDTPSTTGNSRKDKRARLRFGTAATRAGVDQDPNRFDEGKRGPKAFVAPAPTGLGRHALTDGPPIGG